MSFHMNCQRQLPGIKWLALLHPEHGDCRHNWTILMIQEIIDNRRLALFGHVVPLDARIPAHQSLKLSAVTRSDH